MKQLSSLAAGLAGASALTVLHEFTRKKVADAPRMDKMGMEATSKLMRKANLQPPSNDKLYYYSMAGDIFANSLYYSRVASDDKGRTWLNGALLGLTAGLSAVYLPGSLGLNEEYSNHSTKTKLMTVGLYVIGGLVAAATTSLLQGKNKKPLQKLKKSLK